MNAGRNDPCPCGSGRKFKHCCLHRGEAGVVGGARSISNSDPASLVRLFHAGRYSELDRLLKTLLAGQSDSAFLWGLLGASLEAQGQDGREALVRACALDPKNFDANTSLGMALRDRGDLSGALIAFERACATHQQNPVAQFNVGETYRLLGRVVEAEAVLSQLIKRDPKIAEAHVSLADVLADLERYSEAVDIARRAVVLSPASPVPHFCLGTVLQRYGDSCGAKSAYEMAIRMDAGHAAAHDSLGCILQEQGALVEAEKSHREALRYAPGFVNPLRNLGKLYEESNRFADAEAVYREASGLLPGDAVLHERLSYVLHELGRDDEAEVHLDEAIDRGMSYARLLFAKAMLALPVVVRNDVAAANVCGRFSAALDRLASQLEQRGLSPLSIAELAEMPLPFSLAYRNGNQAPLLGRFADLCTRHLDCTILPRPSRARTRLLVVTHHVRRHSVWDIVLRGMLTNIDRSKFEIVIYHLGNQEDEETSYARSLADTWRDRRTISGARDWLNAAVAERADAIFYPELGMASLSYMLAAHRLAPVQVASWGHPVTSGLSTIDLYFSGELLEPVDAKSHYRERLVLLPGTGCCTEPLPIAAVPLSDELAKKISGPGPRFLVAQRAMKFDPADDQIFAAIAARVPDAIFVLLRDPVSPWASDVVCDRLHRAFLASGANPERQIVVLPWLSTGMFMALLDLCDVYLDCPSFSGYTTALQAVRSGLPVVTLEGAYLRHRLAAGLLRQIRCADTVAASPDEYIDIAVRMAKESRVSTNWSVRRNSLRSAATLADSNLEAVRMFEREILATLDHPVKDYGKAES